MTAEGSACRTDVSEYYYSHKTVMGRYKTKDQVFEIFGIPSKKDSHNQRTLWYYLYPKDPRYDWDYDRFIKFTFRGEDVVNWKSRGKDFSEYSHTERKALDNFGTCLAVGLVIDSFVFGAAIVWAVSR